MEPSRGREAKVAKSADKAGRLGYAEMVIVSPKPLASGLENVVSSRPEAQQ